MVYSGDIDSQPSNNYGYDASGNLIKDSTEGIATGAIKWTVYGKVYEVTEKDSTRLTYYYDAVGNRVKKEKYGYSGGSYNLSKTTWYVYDASGTVLGVYEKNYSGDTAVVLREMPLYGSSRIGMLLPNVKRYSTTPDTVGIFSRYVDRRVYELSDHLGNVRAIVGDVKLPVSGLYKADLKGYSNYYPFGMLQPDRHWSSDSYRYGYNGKEKDDEIKGKGTSYDYGARMYDPRVGRWMSRDPLFAIEPGWTPYRAFFDNPLIYIDSDGERERRALKWAVDNLRGIPSYGSADKFVLTKVPNNIVCNEVVFWSYRNIMGDPYGQAKFERQRGDLYNWFNKGKDGTANLSIRRRLIHGTGKQKDNFTSEDLLKAEMGDVLFMGNDGNPWKSNEGHVVLVHSVQQNEDGSVSYIVFGAYARNEAPVWLDFNANGQPEDTEAVRVAGWEMMTFIPTGDKDEQGRTQWRVPGHNNYRLLGIGQVIQPNDDADKIEDASN